MQSNDTDLRRTINGESFTFWEDFGFAVATEALYDDYLKCQLYYACEGQPYAPLPRREWAAHYAKILGLLMAKMNAERHWEQPFSTAPKEILDEVARDRPVSDIESGMAAPTKLLPN